MPVTDPQLPEVDIAALLALTFEPRPSAAMAERVQARVALRTTVAEFARLVAAAPWHWVRDDERSLAETDEEQ